MYEFPRYDLLNKLNRYFLKKLSDDSIERALPVQWSYMHLFSSVQIAKILSVKRVLDTRTAVMCVALHDVATIVKGIREDHAEVGAMMVSEVLSEVYDANPRIERLPSEDLEVIRSAVRNHSDKGLRSENPYDEFTKDVDAFDRYLHSIPPDEDHLFRISQVSDELSLGL